MSDELAGRPEEAREEEALRLARELRHQVSNLRDQARAVGQAIASQPATPDRLDEPPVIARDLPERDPSDSRD
ncbi:MAG: hypothetical protein V4466_06120 [Pseudomonadota bacterium]